MNRGKEPILSNLEKNFVLEAIRESKVTNSLTPAHIEQS